MSDDAARRRAPTSDDAPTEALDALADDVLPALIARLRASRLGELEVRTEGWRVRLRREDSPVLDSAGQPTAPAPVEAVLDLPAGIATSPGVGYFGPLPDLAIGRLVQAGDLLGTIDVLGIAQEVVAPMDGIVGQLLAEDGQAVEYGQALVAIDPIEVDEGPPAAASDDIAGGAG